MPNRTEARSAKAALTNATGRLPLLRLFSTPIKTRRSGSLSPWSASYQRSVCEILLSRMTT